MTITDKIVPGMVGVDIGCGMETMRTTEQAPDFSGLDALIRREAGPGPLRHRHPGRRQSFSELDRDEAGVYYLVVHSGSRAWGFASLDSDYDVRFLLETAPTR